MTAAVATMIVKTGRPAIAALVLIAVAAALMLGGNGAGDMAWAQGTPPPEAMPLGNPTGLTAVPGRNPGDILLRWTPAANAALHLVYALESGQSEGRYLLAPPGDANSETAAGLQIGQTYWFTVVAGRPGAAGAPFQWSQWSNWARATPALPVLPTAPALPGTTATPGATAAPGATVTPTPTADSANAGYANAEVEGIIVALDAGANTFSVWVAEYEHFGAHRPANPLTVDYSAVESIETWLRAWLYIEAEGAYDPATNTLRARIVERESGNDDGDDHSDGSSGGDDNGYGNAEVEGRVIAVDAGANTFTMRVTEYEHFGNSRPSSPLTVDYGAVESIERWLRAGLYIEAEGRYDPATNTLRAHEVERESGNDDDDDDGDDHSDGSSGGDDNGYGSAEVEGRVIAVDAGANTFTMRVAEYEHFGSRRPSSPLTVDYGAVASVERWLRAGLYVEAEGRYDPATNTLRAHEVERESDDDDHHYGDDDDDDHDDDDDDD